jgi:hypothetical protein
MANQSAEWALNVLGCALSKVQTNANEVFRAGDRVGLAKQLLLAPDGASEPSEVPADTGRVRFWKPFRIATEVFVHGI